ncbi:MAG TPA: hypothetical protein VFW96_07720 [Thermomicrobiales bacterium]|nr:hypothetical protein [Thermomicrobiales bacterium]
MAARRTESGRITIVQESRFHLAADDGRGYLFVLARGANVGADDLGRLRAAGARVAVAYTGTPGLASCVAHEVRPAAREAVSAAGERRS